MFKLPEDMIKQTVLKDYSYIKLVEQIEAEMSMSKEEAMEFARGIARTQSRHRFLGALMKRTGQTGYLQDNMYDILRQYYISVARYLAIDEFKAKVIPRYQRQFGMKLGEARIGRTKNKMQAFYIQEFCEKIMGYPGMTELAIDHVLKKIPLLGKHFKSSRPSIWMVNKLLHFTGVTKLGLINIAAGFVNLTQLTNTFAMLPTKYFAMGWRYGFRPSAKSTQDKPSHQAILRRIGVDFDIYLADTGGHSKMHKGGRFIQASMFFFQAAESLNRRVTAIGGYYYAKEKLGYNDKKARAYARALVDKTQFNYSAADTAIAFRNPAGRLAGQFKPFAIKQLEFMVRNVVKGEMRTASRLVTNIKFWIPMFLLTGAFGVPMIEGMFWLIELITGRDPFKETRGALYEWAGDSTIKRFVARSLIFGAFAAVTGMDISRRVGIGDIVPRRASDLLGPTINTLQRAGQIASEGARMDKTEFLKNIAPSLGKFAEALEIVMNDMKVLDPYHRQRLKYVAKPSDIAARAVGVRPLRETEQADVLRIQRYRAKRHNKIQQECIDDAIEGLMQGNGEKFLKAMERASQNGVIITNELLENEIIAKSLPPEVRLFLRTKNVMKGDYINLMRYLQEAESPKEQ